MRRAESNPYALPGRVLLSGTALAWALACALFGAPARGLAAESPAQSETERAPFVRVDGTRFMLGAEPFYFVGANLHVMHGPDARPRAEETIAAAAADGLRVARVWALGEDLPEAPEWKRLDFLFRAGPGGWQERAYEQLDRVIVAAAKHGLKLVVVLSNKWADYGGIPMYLRWAGHKDVEAYGYADRFFTDPRVKAWFLEHVLRIVGRTNALSGVAYRDDPTIMTWELQNELRGTPEAAEARRRWFVEMAREVRRIDPRHLVVPGTIGYDLEVERADWIAMGRLPEASYCDQHIYPQTHLRSTGLRNLQRYIDDRVQLAHHVIGKPIVFGEFGFSIFENQPRERARWHARFLERVFYDGGNGAMVWIYQPKLAWDRPYGVLIDERRDRPLRRVLATRAAWLARRGVIRALNPSLGPARGAEPLAPSHALTERPVPPHAGWRRDDEGTHLTLELPVDGFSRAWFEEAGSWDGGVLVHTYGRRTGWFEYPFVGAPAALRRARLSVRLSSEYPGSSAPEHGWSKVAVRLDAELVTILRVPPDNGRGRWFDVLIEDPDLLARLRGGVHRLRFVVDPGPEANGVAIYGREAPLNREPVGKAAPITLVGELERTEPALVTLRAP